VNSTRPPSRESPVPSGTYSDPFEEGATRHWTGDVWAAKPNDPPERVLAIATRKVPGPQAPQDGQGLMVTTDELPGYEIRRVLGSVFAVESKMSSEHATTNPWALDNVATGFAVSASLDELWSKAQRLGADAVVGMRVAARRSSIIVMGTAVKAAPLTTCPECSNWVSARARKCMYCSSPLAAI